jgi:anti-anti-sigma factor
MSSVVEPRSHPSVFSCSIANANGRVSVGVIGRVDRSSAGPFRNQLLTLAKEHPLAITVDMEHVELPDDAGVAVLVELWRFAHDHGIDLVVTSPCPAVSEAFDVGPSGRLLTPRA